MLNVHVFTARCSCELLCWVHFYVLQLNEASRPLQNTILSYRCLFCTPTRHITPLVGVTGLGQLNSVNSSVFVCVTLSYILWMQLSNQASQSGNSSVPSPLKNHRTKSTRAYLCIFYMPLFWEHFGFLYVNTTVMSQILLICIH